MLRHGQIHLNARAMSPRSAADMSNHHTRSKARAVCNTPKDFSTFANCFSMLIAEFGHRVLYAVYPAGQLLIYRVDLAESFWSTASILGGEFLVDSVNSSRRGAECRFSCRKHPSGCVRRSPRVLPTRSSKGVSNSNIKAGICHGQIQQLFQLLYIVLQLPI